MDGVPLDPETLAGLDDAQIAGLVAALPDTVVSSLNTLLSPRGERQSLETILRAIAVDFHDRPHSRLLLDRLSEGVARAEAGDDVRLIVSLPPGSGKSTISSVALPLFALARNPHWEVGIVSAEESLAVKWSRDCRRAITEGMVPGVELEGAATVTEWETTRRGSLIARGVGGSITGRRLRLLSIDDPVKNFADAHSKTVREGLWDVWRSVLKTRMRPGSMVVLTMTRWHQDDLAGRLLAQSLADGWEEIRIPAIAEAGDLLGRAPGEPLLSTQRDETPAEALTRWAATREEVGTYVWDALYQQRPAPPGGSVFKSEWWQYHAPSSLPPDVEGTWLTSWDLTYGTGGPNAGDWVVGQVWQHVEGVAYLIDQVRGRWPFTEQVHQIEALAARYPQCTAHLVEKAANGAAAIDTVRRTIPGVIPVRPEGSKEVRAQAVSPMVEAGQVSLPAQAPWLGDLVSELRGFPSSAHDDMVDALTQALNRFRKPHTAQLHVPTAVGAVASGAGLGAMRRGF